MMQYADQILLGCEIVVKTGLRFAELCSIGFIIAPFGLLVIAVRDFLDWRNKR